uniref:Putative ovule protein n=1 Tax=Solanum chacoense TaxID=4108 RepID=A0A0V0GP44_SOLCH
MHEPQTLQKACRLARLVEATLSAYARGSRPVDLSSPSVRKEGPTARSSNYSYQQISRGVMANTLMVVILDLEGLFHMLRCNKRGSGTMLLL